MHLKVKNDFIFQQLFANPEHKDILEGFLEAILNIDLTDIEIIENKNLPKKLPQEKLGIVDVRAKINGETKVNIEIQLINQYNMDKRTLFYWSKLYTDQFTEGTPYKELQKTITINLLDFEYINLPTAYHTTYHLWEDQHKEYKLTDILEIHFIEFPKFIKHGTDLDQPLERWLTFMENPSQELAHELMEKDQKIAKAYNLLDYLSQDEETRRYYELREKAINDEISRLSGAKDEGIEQGIEQGIEIGAHQKALSIAQALLNAGNTLDFIAQVTGLSISDIEQLSITK